MRMHHYRVKMCGVAVATALMLAAHATATPTTITLDFDDDQNGNALVDGQSIDAAFDVADATPEFTGLGEAQVTITSTGFSSGRRVEGHLGATIFDSDPPESDVDGDLEVGLGNVLILQSDGNGDTDDLYLESQKLPGGGFSGRQLDQGGGLFSYEGGRAFDGNSGPEGGFIFVEPNDNRVDSGDTPSGGSIIFDFATEVELQSINLIDIDGGVELDLILTDDAGLTRSFDVESNFTFQGNTSGADGFSTLDLTVLGEQDGEPLATGVATGTEDAGFDQASVVRFEVLFDGSSPSAAIDGLVYVIPEPSTAALLGLTGLAALRRRRK